MPDQGVPSSHRAQAAAAPPSALTAAAVSLALARVPLGGPPEAMARACAAELAPLLGGAVRLVIQTLPMPVRAGEAEGELRRLLCFRAAGAEAELWVPAGAPACDASVAEYLGQQLARLLEVPEQTAALQLEVDRLRFQITALQQVARTLAVVRQMEETERLALDSIGEVFFAWWAALYRQEGEQYLCRAVRSLRGEPVADAIPLQVVRPLGLPGRGPLVPAEDAEIRDHIRAEIALVVPLDLGERSQGLLILGPRMTQAPYDSYDLALLRALADASAVALRNADLLDRLRAQATIDPLTGCHNRRGFDELLAVELARSRRHQHSLALVLLDIDHFKRINDELGHEAGDQALRQIGRTLRNAFRVSDSACRYGGEEFAMIFPETSKAEGARLAERLRVLIESPSLEHEVRMPMTASLGVAAYPEDAQDPLTLFRLADRALYQAKAEGRNRVVAAQPALAASGEAG